MSRSREIRNLTLSNSHLKRELTIVRRSRDEAVEKARLMRINLSVLSIDNEMLRQTNESLGKLAMSALNANQNLQAQLKLRSHPGIDVFMGRRRKEEGPYCGLATGDSAQQANAANQGSGDSEVGSDSTFRKASVENSVMSELINNDGNTVFLTEMSSGKVDSESGSYYESDNASGINASWEGAGTSWSIGSQQSSVALGVLTEAEYKKLSEPQIDEFAWLYMEHGRDCNDSGGSVAGNFVRLILLIVRIYRRLDSFFRNNIHE